MRYSGHPPIHPMYVATLQTQIAEAHAVLKRGVDFDWRAAVLLYPEVLGYFYSLVELRTPKPGDPCLKLDVNTSSTDPASRVDNEQEKRKGKGEPWA
jgi:hypothetical protein